MENYRDNGDVELTMPVIILTMNISNNPKIQIVRLD